MFPSRRWSLACALLALLIGIVLQLLSHPRRAPLVTSSSSLGAVSASSARIWALSDVYSRFRVELRPRPPANQLVRSSEWIALVDRLQNCSVAVVDKLSAGTTYDYVVEFAFLHSDDVHERRQGSFTTFDVASPSFEFVFGSCTHSSWWGPVAGLSYVARTLRPAFALVLGDLVYSDLPFRSRFDEIYRRTVVDSGFVDIGERIPMFNMYDDHEIENDWVKGPEDALYVEAMKYYRAFFGIRNPPSPVAGEHYYNFSIGTSSFFVLDSRKHADRCDRVEGALRSKLGAEQKSRLLEWLQDPAPLFKFIASSVAWSTRTAKVNNADAWLMYRHERDEIFGFIERHNISGVVLLSGDIHWCGVFRLTPFRFLHEFSASPIQSFPLLPMPWLSWNTSEEMLYWNSAGKHIGHVQVRCPEQRDHAFLVFTDYRTLPFSSAPKRVFEFRLNWSSTIPQPYDASETQARTRG